MKRLLSAVLAVSLLLSVAAPASAFNVYPGVPTWATYHVGVYSHHVYFCFNGAWPGGVYGTKANIVAQGIDEWNDVSATLRYDATWNRLCVVGLANQYILTWGTAPETQNPPPAATAWNRKNSVGDFLEVQTYFNPNTSGEWWSTAKQSCVNREDNSPTDCRIDMFVAATHEAGHALGLNHRPQPQSAGHDCVPGYYYTSTASACLPVNGGIYGLDVMWTAAADGYYRRLTSDDKAGCRYLYGALVG